MGSVGRFLLGLKYRWMPVSCIREVNGGLDCQRLTISGWQSVEPEALPETTLFSSQVILIPDTDCSFSARRYPLDMVDANDLDEAVALDIEQWSPFTTAYRWLSFVDRDVDSWRVAVWVWPEATELRLSGRLLHRKCTHVMPEMAWYVASVRAYEPALLVHATADRRAYALLSESSVPQSIAYLGDGRDVRFFLRGLGWQRNSVKQAWLTAASEEVWLPDGVSGRVMDATAVPKLSLLNRARLDGVKDWSDPWAWRSMLSALLLLCMAWMAADWLLLSQKGSELDDTLAKARKSAQVVLDIRSRVGDMQDQLQRITGLKRAQQLPERLLADLSRAIPTDIWISSLHMNGRLLDILGQGRGVVRLIVLMQGLDGIEHVSFVNELRPYGAPADGLESFRLRLVLKAGYKSGPTESIEMNGV